MRETRRNAQGRTEREERENGERRRAKIMTDTERRLRRRKT